MYSVRGRKVKYEVGVCLCVASTGIAVFRHKKEIILAAEKRRLEKCAPRIVNYRPSPLFDGILLTASRRLSILE